MTIISPWWYFSEMRMAVMQIYWGFKWPRGCRVLWVMFHHLDKSDDLLYRSSRWLDNFEEMKKATRRLSMSVVHRNGWCCVLISRCWCRGSFLHGWMLASLICLLGSLRPKGNKVPANTYQAKKLIKLAVLGV
jgi:hypothetical protein